MVQTIPKGCFWFMAARVSHNLRPFFCCFWKFRHHILSEDSENKFFHGPRFSIGVDWSFFWEILDVPSGKHTKNYGKSPCYSWVNPLFLSPCSIAFCNKLPGRVNWQRTIQLSEGPTWSTVHSVQATHHQPCVIR